jgi:predicted NodU family carbamoyl transferase
VSGSDPDDKDLYDLLGYFDGKPLLNTSFNVQGKPIINSLEEALDMLNNSGLDHVCLKHKNKYYLFT